MNDLNVQTIVRYNMQYYNALRTAIPLPKISKMPNVQFSDRYSDDDIEIDMNCGLYMAESSIPNAGFGMYAGRDIEPEDFVDPSPQIVIPLIDMDDHPDFPKSVLSLYPWNPMTQGAHLESDVSSVLYPNLGMLANSHLGLINTVQWNSDGIHISDGVEDRESDYSTGAISEYSSHTFTSHSAIIEQGTELLVDYGETYFHDREERFGTIFPTENDYDEADMIIEAFVEDNNVVEGNITDDVRAAWGKIIADLQRNETMKRVVFALPKDVENVTYAEEMGTARFSIPNFTRTIEWLEHHGACVDNLRVGKSSIPYAGKGAFAVRPILQNDVIAPLPLLPVQRFQLYMDATEDDEQDDDILSYSNDQLLLNYCFGHQNSSLLFFPYSSTVHYINHSPEANAQLRWAHSELGKKNDFQHEIDNVVAGMVMELVALRNIKMGEEVTINYGESWVSSWNQHVLQWNITTEQRHNPKQIIKKLNNEKNKPFRTLKEQVDNPYPHCVRTACYSNEQVSGNYQYGRINSVEHLLFCDIIERFRAHNRYWYIAKMEKSQVIDDEIEESAIVIDIPHDAIIFVPDKYCTDIHVINSFRHEIEVPKDLKWPEHWLDNQFDTVWDDEVKSQEESFESSEKSSKREEL
jgi:hypothetical protein